MTDENLRSMAFAEKIFSGHSGGSCARYKRFTNEKMLGNHLSWHILLLPLLDLIIKTHPTLHDSSHGFISKNPRYFDNLAHLHEEISSLVTGMSDLSLGMELKFEPPILDFKQRPLGIPHLEKVTLFNTKNKSIDMTSISGNTLHFHSSFFEDKKIPPNGNTTFNVVFLGRTEGFKESNLFIHTSEGFVKYCVKGVSTFSHYRIRPIIGVKVPLNSSFSPLIHMHNPYSEPIQISEIYCTGEGFHLELLTGQKEAPNNLWMIGPQQTKPIIRLRFEAKMVHNYTAYLRIKLSKPNELLVVPLEVEVTSVFGVFHPKGFVDFGIGGNLDPPKEVRLCLYNPTKRYVKISSVSTLSKAIKVQYFYARLPPVTEMEEGKCAVIGSLTIDWKTAFETKDFSGKIVIRYRNSKTRSKIPYFLTAIRGGLKYDPMVTYYFINDKSIELSQRSFQVRNEYEMPVYIYNVSFPEDAHSYFKFESFTPKALRVGEEGNIFKIKLKNVKLSDLHLNSQIVLKTNISDISVPLLSYNGKLNIHLPFQNKNNSLNIGLMGYNTEKEVHFILLNQNPIVIYLNRLHCSVPMAHVEVLGCGSEDAANVLLQSSFQNLTKCQNMKPYHYAIIRIIVKSTNAEHQASGHITIETQFETIKIPVSFKVASGKIEIDPNELVFEGCFPAKICTRPLRIHSTFNEPMIIEKILALPPDKTVNIEHSEVIPAQTSKIIGKICINPNLACGANCFAGMIDETTAQWMKTFSLNEFISDLDISLINTLYSRYLNQTQSSQKSWQNLALRLDTSEVKGHVFKAKVKMIWPSLVNMQNTLTFPLTQVGNVSYQNLTVHNPASYNVLVQLVLGGDYPEVEGLFSKIPEEILSRNKRDHRFSKGFFFPNRTRHEQSIYFWEHLGLVTHQDSVPILLKPGENFTVQIGFQAKDSGVYSGLLFIRNNLTILEVVSLQGQAAFPMFKFGNRKPGSVQSLTFDLTPKHLKDCERNRGYSSTTMPNFVVKRTFTARNMGEIPIYISNFYLNDHTCEGYGFKIVDCDPFMLPPNGTKKIDIMFTPDFTMSKISRTLILETSLNIPVNYSLYTTVPVSHLGLCSELILRPSWERYLGYLTVGFMLLNFVIVVLMAMIDAEQTRKPDVPTFTPSVQPILDLRLVGQQTKEEIHNNSSSSSCSSNSNSSGSSSTKQEVEVVEEKVVKEEKVVVDSVGTSKEFEEELKPKPELERYTVLVPTVGRAKKRIAKKNSNELEAQETVIEVKKEKVWEPKSKKEKETPKGVEKEAKKAKKHLNEEEVSSATDSSSCSNCEEQEKKPKVVISGPEVKVENVKPKGPENVVHIPETTKYISHYIKVRHKSLQKMMKTADKANKNPNNHSEYQTHNKHLHMRDTKKREKGKDREKKIIYHKNKDKNRQLEKHLKAASVSVETETTDKSKNPTGFNIPLPPPTTTSTVWGESRAKFSDVVARSDCTKVVSKSNNQSGKPIVYVEPYKQLAPAELGPIGSRPERRSPIEGANNIRSQMLDDGRNFLGDRFRQQVEPDNGGYLPPVGGFLRDANQSFFSDEIRIDNCGKENCYGVDRMGWGASYVPPMEPKCAPSSNMEDPWNHSLLNSSSYWDSYNPLLAEPPSPSPLLVGKDPLLGEVPSCSTPISQSQQPQSSSAAYLWGGSSVWQPWTPAELPRTPTRTPPGFDEFVHRKRDEIPGSPETYATTYNPSSLWNHQQQNNPWN